MTEILSSLSGLPWADTLLLPTLSPLLAAATEAEAETGPIVLAGVLLSLVVIYIASKLGGELSRLVDLPPVLGELVAGVVVGTSALNLIVFPESGAMAADSQLMSLLQWIGGLSPEAVTEVFKSQSEVVSVLAELGVIILLFEIGLESDLRELQKVGYQAAIVACVGVAAPFALGTAGLMVLFHVPTIPAIFAGAALTATSIGITSKVLSEIGQLKSAEGQIIVGAAVIDDVLGIIVLAVVASLAKTGEVDVMNVIYLIVSATGFLLGAIFLGKFFNSSFIAIADKLQAWMRQLLLVAQPAELPAVIVGELQKHFLIPQAAIKVWGVDVAYAQQAFATGVSAEAQVFVSGLSRPYCGPHTGLEASRWLPDAPSVQSMAVIALRAGAAPEAFGALVLASGDRDRFAADMATDFLQRIGELAGAALSRLRAVVPAVEASA